MKQIFQDYDISAQFTPVNTLKISLVHPKDKPKKAVKVMLSMKFASTLSLSFQDTYIGVTSQPLQHRPKQHCRSSYNGNESAVLQHINVSGHQIDVNDVTILDREKNRFERGVKDAVWVRTKNKSLEFNGGTRITLSHFWDRSINTTQIFFNFR